MNNFVKFPLVLGIVGLICTGALTVVYEVTKERITYNQNKEAITLLSEILSDVKNAEPVLDDYDATKAKNAGIKNIYEVSDSNGVTAYGYLAEANGYNPGINFLLVLDSDEEIIRGFSVVSHSETNSGTYGGPLLDSPDFAAQFKDIAFSDVAEDVDFVAGSTAKVTLGAVKTGVEKVISFHKEAIFGEASTGINLTDSEIEKLGLAEGYVVEDKTDDFKAALKANTSTNKYDKTMESLGLINFIEIKDANGTVKGHAYAVEGKYNCEVEHGNRAWQSYKIALVFDENDANTKLVVLSSGDSLPAANQLPLDQQPWVADSFNGKTINELNEALANDEIDYVHGATFTTNAIKAHVATIVGAHVSAYGN